MTNYTAPLERTVLDLSRRANQRAIDDVIRHRIATQDIYKRDGKRHASAVAPNGRPGRAGGHGLGAGGAGGSGASGKSLSPLSPFPICSLPYL